MIGEAALPLDDHRLRFDRALGFSRLVEVLVQRLVLDRTPKFSQLAFQERLEIDGHFGRRRHSISTHTTTTTTITIHLSVNYHAI